jgi:hypothetical protein
LQSMAPLLALASGSNRRPRGRGWQSGRIPRHFVPSLPFTRTLTIAQRCLICTDLECQLISSALF